MSIPAASHARKSVPSLDGLSATASTLNAASRRLNNAVEQLNAALKKLNLGISTWVPTYSKDGDPNQVCEYEEIGYAKVKGTWGICLRLTLEGLGPDSDEREWHFDDAPRDMRIRGAEHLHRLIEKLNEDAKDKAEKIDVHATETEKLANTINTIAEASKGHTTLLTRGGK